jgi:hypothetical protein
MPHYKRPFDKGDLFVTFEVEFPPPGWLPVAKLPQLEALLPEKMKLDIHADHAQEVDMIDYDPAAHANGRSSSNGGGRGTQLPRPGWGARARALTHRAPAPHRERAGVRGRRRGGARPTPGRRLCSAVSATTPRTAAASISLRVARPAPVLPCGCITEPVKSLMSLPATAIAAMIVMTWIRLRHRNQGTESISGSVMHVTIPTSPPPRAQANLPRRVCRGAAALGRPGGTFLFLFLLGLSFACLPHPPLPLSPSLRVWVAFFFSCVWRRKGLNDGRC